MNRQKRLDTLQAAAVERWRTEWDAVKAGAVAALKAGVTPEHRAAYQAHGKTRDVPTFLRLVRLRGLYSHEWYAFYHANRRLDERPEPLDVTPAALPVPEEPPGAWDALWGDALSPETAAAAVELLTMLAFARAVRSQRARC